MKAKTIIAQAKKSGLNMHGKELHNSMRMMYRGINSYQRISVIFGVLIEAPAFLPGESQGWGSLVGCCLWGRTESDTTEAT